MYIPGHFEITDEDEIYAFLDKNNFGQLISTVKARIFSTHLPFLLSEDKSKLLGHLALQNPQYAELEGQEVLVTMEGAHDYISPSWYNSPGVPTWNYQAVHIYGHCTVLRDPQDIEAIVNALTAKHEAAFETLWEPEYKSTMLGAIVGIEVSIDEIQCKYKLSQNRSAQDRAQVIQQLRKVGSDKLAGVMTRNET